MPIARTRGGNPVRPPAVGAAVPARPRPMRPGQDPGPNPRGGGCQPGPVASPGQAACYHPPVNPGFLRPGRAAAGPDLTTHEPNRPEQGGHRIMLAASTVEALTAALAHTEAAAERAGWDGPPELIGLFDRAVTSTERDIEIDPFPLEASAWRIPDPHRPGHDLPVPAVLQAIADTLIPPTTPSWLPDWLHDRGRTLIGFGFCCEGWATAGYPGY